MTLSDLWLPPVEDIAASFVSWEDQRSPSLLLEAARGKSRGIATLLSWWKLQGRPLPVALSAELECHRARLARYASCLERARTVEPRLIAAKGPIAWRLYPPGLVRQTSDIDIILPSAAGLWAVASQLLSDGWSTEALWIWKLDGAVHFHLMLKRSHGQPMLMSRDKVELNTISYQGDHVRREPRTRTWGEQPPSASDWLHWLTEELGERPVRMRDIFDLAVMIQAAEESDPDVFAADAAALIARYGARRQLRLLVGHARRHYPKAEPLLRQVERRAAELPHRRLPWMIRRHPTAASLAALMAVARRPGRTALRDRADDALIAMQNRLRGDRILELGLPLYAKSVSATDVNVDVTLCSGRDGAVWLDSPAGRFVATLGSALRQEWIDQAVSGVTKAHELQLV
jgi:hypothetical protein